MSQNKVLTNKVTHLLFLLEQLQVFPIWLLEALAGNFKYANFAAFAFI
jgi:hypothetical protein